MCLAIKLKMLNRHVAASSADDRPDSRSSHDTLELHLRSLIDAFHSAEATAFLANFEQRSVALANKNTSWHDAKQEPLDYRDRI